MPIKTAIKIVHSTPPDKIAGNLIFAIALGVITDAALKYVPTDCTGCKHHHNGNGDETCRGCYRNYEEDCFEPNEDKL